MTEDDEPSAQHSPHFQPFEDPSFQAGCVSTTLTPRAGSSKHWLGDRPVIPAMSMTLQ